ncbi:hypothetical protein Trydic_g19073 [Trypoxylus dichotomus]
MQNRESADLLLTFVKDHQITGKRANLFKTAITALLQSNMRWPNREDLIGWTIKLRKYFHKSLEEQRSSEELICGLFGVGEPYHSISGSGLMEAGYRPQAIGYCTCKRYQELIMYSLVACFKFIAFTLYIPRQNAQLWIKDICFTMNCTNQ